MPHMHLWQYNIKQYWDIHLPITCLPHPLKIRTLVLGHYKHFRHIPVCILCDEWPVHTNSQCRLQALGWALFQTGNVIYLIKANDDAVN